MKSTDLSSFEKKTGDKHTGTDLKASLSVDDVSKDESCRIDANDGENSSSNHNQVESPGKKYREQDGSH
jgi:hypothetical protein